MRQQIATLLLAGTLTLYASQALPAGAPVEPAPEPVVADDVEDITITGQRPGVLRQMMEDLIIEIGDPVSSTRGYARWRDRLCVGVYNLPDPKIAQYIADKITVVALEMGMNTGEPGCSPGLHIVFSPDARALATQMVEATPRMFMPYGGTEGTTQGLAALERFKSSEAPVRWWQITMIVDEFGYPAIMLPGNEAEGMPAQRAIGGSRLKASNNDALWASLVIVDANKLGDVKWPQLADYLAMVSLAQIDPDGTPGNNSILSLFTASTPPGGLTDLDLTYLHGLYGMDTMMMPATQRGIFSHRMVRELGELNAEE